MRELGLIENERFRLSLPNDYLPQLFTAKNNPIASVIESYSSYSAFRDAKTLLL